MKEVKKPQERFEDMHILDELKNSYLNYAMSVIVSRALPDVRDGLKPSQRRILVAMNDLNLGPRSKHRKCAKIVGDTGGNYHPHGDQATYGTLVRLGQEWNMRYPLIDPQGNFGSIDSDPPAAMRYTEARMAAPAMEILEDINHDTVDFVPNYDETRQEPTVLPSKFPNLLVNGSTGIAVGMATNIPPHNITEVCDALLLVIEDPKCGFKDIIKCLPGPDFPTGGIICGKKGIREAYTTGRGHLMVRGKVDIEVTKRGRERIVITEIPYMVVKTTIVSKIAGCVQNGTIGEIADIRDESDRHGLRIVVDLRRDTDAEIVLNKLYRYTPLQSTFAIANIALVNNRPEALNIREMLDCFIDHRKTVVRRRSRFLLKRCRNRAHILEGLILAVSDIDEIIELIKKSPDTPAAKLNLMGKPLRLAELATLKKILPKAFVKEKSKGKHFLTGPQADAILTMQLQRLTGLEMEKLAKEYAELTEQIEGYEAILASDQILLDIIREDIYEIKEKYDDARRTKITTRAEQFAVEDLIAEEEVIVTVSHSGYVKRMPIDTYRRQARGGRGIIGSVTKEGDFIEHLFVASTHDYLLIFTNRGKCYWLKVYDVPSMSRQSKGRNIVNLLKLGSQQIASIINVSTFDGEGEEDAQQRQLIMATKNGLVKKTKLSAYSNPRATGVIAINLDPNDDLIGVTLTVGSDHIVLGTRDGMTIRFDEGQVRSMGRASRGVRGIKLRPGDRVVDMVIVEEKAALFTVCENGYGKRTGLENYRPQSRGGVGLKNIKTTARNGKVVALKAVQHKDDLVMITANGMIIRTGLDQIRSIGRNTQGVRLIKLKGGDKLVAAEKIIAEDANNNAKDKSGSNQKSQLAAEAKAEPMPKPKPKPKPKRKPKSKSKPKPKKISKTKPKPRSKSKAKKTRREAGFPRSGVPAKRDANRESSVGMHEPIYVIAGKENSLLNAQCRELLDHLLEPSQRTTGLFDADPASVSASEVLDELRTVPFLTDKRVVFVKGADDFISKNRQLLEQYFDNPCPTGVLVLAVSSWQGQTKLARKLSKVGKLIKVTQPKPWQLPARLSKYASDAHDKKLTKDAAELLIELVGDELTRLYSEIDKLALFADTDKSITPGHIELLIGHNRLFNTFAVIDAVIAGRAAQAVERLRRMFAGDKTAEYTVVGAFAFHFRRMFNAKVLLEKGVRHDEVANRVRIWSNKDNFFAQLRQMSLKQIGGYLQQLGETDYAIKTGRTKVKVAMEQLVLKLAANSTVSRR